MTRSSAAAARSWHASTAGTTTFARWRSWISRKSSTWYVVCGSTTIAGVYRTSAHSAPSSATVEENVGFVRNRLRSIRLRTCSYRRRLTFARQMLNVLPTRYILKYFICLSSEKTLLSRIHSPRGVNSLCCAPGRMWTTPDDETV